ncbi:MAG: 50S ribosomal protein L25 [Candidatus Marinimicrobia bacterium]|nr:50S ribosomal protein L25 [Candidatus Neomarinimicrobiota bacterium]
MTNEFTLEVTKRDSVSKNEIKQMRKEGKVPGIYYSHDSKNSIPFYIERQVLRQAYKSGARIFNINVGNKKRTVIFKSVDYHPVTDQVLHIDLYGVKMDQAVTISVELKLTGSAQGVVEGGILVQGLNELEIDCLPMDIPEFLEVDISKLNLGDSLRVADLQLDEKFAIKSSEDQIIASVTHPMKEVETTDSTEEEGEFLDESGASTESESGASEGSGNTEDNKTTEE